MSSLRSALALAALVALPAVAAEPRIAPYPALPAYGQPVELEIANANWLAYLPASRYTRSGNNIVVDIEYLTTQFGPFSPAFGTQPLALGELAAGNYTVQARLHDIGAGGAPTVITGTIAVVPPSSWGIYMVPQAPQAFAATEVMITSAAYFDPASMRARVAGSVVRVEFDYQADAPASGPAPPGMRTYAAVAVPGLAPGNYRVEGWGRRTTGGEHELYFTRDITVASTVPVVEFYSATLDHYFMAAGADEIALLDRGGRGDWKRTGHRFNAWARQADAPPTAVAVCRFYARGPNSHFYTGSRDECESLKALEQRRRADALAAGRPYLDWGYEGIAFWSVMPRDGACPSGMAPVWRAYNDRAAAMDSNHRFTADPLQRLATTTDWIDEGVHLCSPG